MVLPCDVGNQIMGQTGFWCSTLIVGESELSPLLDEVARRLGGQAQRDEALRTVARRIRTLALSRALKGTGLDREFTRAAQVR